jgi:hypothetical protein
MLSSHRRDALIEFIIELLNHSFVLAIPQTYHGTMLHIEGMS